jgi:hypothetical protein
VVATISEDPALHQNVDELATPWTNAAIKAAAPIRKDSTLDKIAALREVTGGTAEHVRICNLGPLHATLKQLD